MESNKIKRMVISLVNQTLLKVKTINKSYNGYPLLEKENEKS